MYRRLLIFLALFAAIAGAQTPAPIANWDSAATAESELAIHPENLTVRGQLIQFYFTQSLLTQSRDRAKPLRRQHVLWMIESHPENRALAGQAGAMESSGNAADPEGYAACSAAWQKALSAPKPLFDAFTNAIAFYTNTEPQRAREIADAGLKLYPGNANIARQKGVLLARSISGATGNRAGVTTAFDENLAGSDQAKQDRAELLASDDINMLMSAGTSLTSQAGMARPRYPALANDLADFTLEMYRHWGKIDPNNGSVRSGQMNVYRQLATYAGTAQEKIDLLEKALALADSPGMRISTLPNLAEAYLDAGRPTKAAEAANEMLKSDQVRNSSGFYYPGFIANSVLGRVALKQGDVREAALRLLAAGRGPSAPQSAGSTPPDWKLAQDLLSAGDRDSVLAYIEEVRGWWKAGASRLNAFASSIRNGMMPDFTGSAARAPSQLVGRPAPELRLPDLNGSEVALSDFKGKVVILDFWATWCGPCREGMPEFEKIHRQPDRQDVAVLTVDPDEDREKVAAYMEKERLTFPVLLAKGTDAIARWDVHAYPTTMAIDKNGLVASITIGYSPGRDALSPAIERARAGAPAPAQPQGALPPAIYSGGIAPLAPASAQAQITPSMSAGVSPRESAALGAPQLLSPPDGAVFNAFPRTTTVTWSPVPGAAAYVVEWDYQYRSVWASEDNHALGTMRVTSPAATFGFVGAQPGRWRVHAVDATGAAGPKSEWRLFRYTQ